MSFLKKPTPVSTLATIRLLGSSSEVSAKVDSLERIAAHLSLEELALLAKAVTNPTIKRVALEKLKILL